MATQYVGSTKWTAVTAWAASTAYSVGNLRRQLAAPTAGNERVWRCTTAGTSGGTEPSWTLTAGSTTNDGSVVWTEVTGLSTYNAGGAWSAPHARLTTALEWVTAGDTVKVHASHDASYTATTIWYIPGDNHTAITRIVCVNDGDTARATTAMERVTGTNVGAIRGGGAGYFYGLTFQVSNHFLLLGDGATTWMRCEACVFEMTEEYTLLDIDPGSGVSLEWVNTKFKCTNPNNWIRVGGRFVWSNTPSAIQGAAPTYEPLFQMRGTGYQSIECRNVDLSALGSGSVLMQFDNDYGDALFVDCKLGSSVALASGSPTYRGGTRLKVVNCDSADTNYRYARHIPYVGTIVSETTIVRTGGASNGTTPVSRKVVTTANAKLDDPVFSDWMEFWNETVGSSVTVSIPTVTDNVTLKDDELWIEVEYLGTSGFPLGLLSSSRIADPIYGTPANVATDGVSTWTTTGLTTPVKQLPSVSVTPQEKGIIRARVCVAKASTTVYFDPKAN